MTHYAYYDDSDFTLNRFLGYSVLFHVALCALTLIGIYAQRTTGDLWGGRGTGGDNSAVTVNLVSRAGLPMPQPTTFADSHVVDPTKGMAKEEPPPPPEIPTEAMEIPKFDKEKPLAPSKPSKVFENKKPRPDNSINYGKGGGTSLPSSYSNEPGPLSSGGVGMKGEGGGDFAGRYAWYIESVRRAVSQNWMQNTIDPAVRASRRAHCTTTFTIARDGTIKNIRLAQSSGNSSFDTSAQRALLSIDHLPPLPRDYSGTYVDVTFDFDLGMNQ